MNQFCMPFESNEKEGIQMSDSDAAETLSEEFFVAGRQATTNHEEWLLRLCSQLMHREASAVSILEEQVTQNPGRNRNRKWTPRSKPTLNSTSTEPSTGTAGPQ